jgi:hypothetical protein
MEAGLVSVRRLPGSGLDVIVNDVESEKGVGNAIKTSSMGDKETYDDGSTT